MIDIKKFRKEYKIKQSEICEILNIAQPYLSAIESGKRPLSKDKFELLYNHYGDILLEYKLEDPITKITESNYKPKQFDIPPQKNKSIELSIFKSANYTLKDIEHMQSEIIHRDKQISLLEKLLEDKEKIIQSLESELNDLKGINKQTG